MGAPEATAVPMQWQWQGGPESDDVLGEWVLPVAVIFVDVNKFKAINDTFGHKRVTTCWLGGAHTGGCTGETDHVARFGGDEFVIVLRMVGRRGRGCERPGEAHVGGGAAGAGAVLGQYWGRRWWSRSSRRRWTR